MLDWEKFVGGCWREGGLGVLLKELSQSDDCSWSWRREAAPYALRITQAMEVGSVKNLAEGSAAQLVGIPWGGGELMAVAAVSNRS
jgi:hypothetical protein